MSRLPTVLLDLDDTLFDHRATSRAALLSVRGAHPALAARAPDDLVAEYLRLVDEIHPSVLAGQRTTAQGRVERFRRLAGPGEAGAAERLAAAYDAAYRACRFEVPGAGDLLRALRGRAKVGIVTNNVLSEQAGKIADLGFTGLVDALVASGDAGVAKPDPEIFRIALRRLRAAPADAVMLGDSFESDVQGARAAGIRAVWLNQSGAPAPFPVEEIRSLVPLSSVLRILLP